MPATPQIVDSHCHLDFPDFAEELPQVIARAQAAGVTRMVTICTRRANAPQVRAIAEAHDPVFWAGGTHPMSAAKEPMASVEDSLRRHIEAARRTGLPLIIHARAADEDMARILIEEHRAGAYGCVMHCFSSGAALAAAALDLGFYLSMSGIAAFPKSAELREIFAAAPVDRILVETDAPYLAPPPHRGKRNEPAYTAHTARVGAELFGLSEAEFATRTSANFDRLFWKAARWQQAA